MTKMMADELAHTPMTWRMRRIRDGLGPLRSKGAVTMLPIDRAVHEMATRIAKKRSDMEGVDHLGEAWIVAFEVVHSQAQAIYMQRNGGLIERCQAIAEDRMESFIAMEIPDDNDPLDHVVVDVSQDHEMRDQERWLDAMLSLIPDRERYVIATRLGQAGQSLTLDQLATAYGVTRQGIEQMVRKWERILTRRWIIDTRYDPYAPIPIPRAR